MLGELGGEDMKESDYDKWQIELSLAEHLFLAEEYEKALEPNLKIGERLHELFDFSSALQFADRAVICSEKTRNKEKLIKSLNQKGNILRSTFRYSEAFEFHNKSLEIAKEMGFNIYCTSLTMYDACGRLYAKGLKGIHNVSTA